MQRLKKIIDAVKLAGSLEEAMNRLVQELRIFIQVDAASVFIQDVAKNRYLLFASDGLSQEAVGHSSLPFDQGLVGVVAQREEPLNLSRADQHPQNYVLDDLNEAPFTAFLGVPVVFRGQVLAVIVLQRLVEQKFDVKEESLLTTLAALLGEILQTFESRDAVFGYNFSAKDPQGVKFSGNGASPGIAMGQVVVLVSNHDFQSIPIRFSESRSIEFEKLSKAVEGVRQDLFKLREKMDCRLGEQSLSLFSVYEHLLDDPSFIGEVENLVEQGFWAQSAIRQVVLDAIATFEAIEDDYIKERITDIKDIGSRLLSHLQTHQFELPQGEGPFILVGHELCATLLMDIPQEKIKGVVSLKGTTNAHMAIIARAIELPAIVGVENIQLDIIDRQPCILDGNTGQFIVSPSHQQTKVYREYIEGHQELQEYLVANVFRPTATKCGESYELLANVGVESDADSALMRAAQGIGLYRTEIGFLGFNRFPSESEQVTLYSNYLQKFYPMPVTLRTLDIGGDKSLPYFPIDEINPVLGWRGLRVTLDHPEIMLIQLRAMLKASLDLNNLKILIPMVSDTLELNQASALIQRAYNELQQEGLDIRYPKIGTMIEIPAAVSQMHAFAKYVDFFSVGSNDLIQYLLAVDRNNSKVAHLYQPFNPSVLYTLQDILDRANRLKTEICICGEAAGDPAMTVLLMGMGYRSFSLGPQSLLKVKWTLSQMKVLQMRNLWLKVSKLETVDQILETVMTRLSHYGVVSGFSSIEAQKYQQKVQQRPQSGAAAG